MMAKYSTTKYQLVNFLFVVRIEFKVVCPSKAK